MNKASAVSGDIAITAMPAENLAITAILVNPTRTTFNNLSGDRLPGNVQLGVAYTEADNFCLAAKLLWNNFEQVNCSMGAEYVLIKQFSLLAGVEYPEIISYSFGVGMALEQLGINISGKLHPQLGLSSAFSLSYKIR
jgi:hypothetical protein